MNDKALLNLRISCLAIHCVTDSLYDQSIQGSEGLKVKVIVLR